MVILQAFFSTMQEGKQAITAQHRITNSLVFNSSETVGNNISGEHSDPLLRAI